MEVTLLWLKPETSQMVWIESRYQYRHRNTFRSVSGREERNALRTRVNSFFASVNAEAPLTVVNTRGFDLPKTGDHGTWMYSIGGVLLMAVAASAMFFALRKKGSVN